MNELARIGDVRSVSVFCFRVAKFVYQAKKQYSTANTVLLLPLTTKKQYHTALNPTNTKINNSTTVPLYMTPTYNSKTAVQYRMTPIYNSTLIIVPLCKKMQEDRWMAMDLVIYVARQFGIKEYFSGWGGFIEAESSWGTF